MLTAETVAEDGKGARKLDKRAMADGADLIVPRAGVGQPVRRHEDARLLTGRGRFGDDLSLPGQAVAWVLRSPHAHAEVAAIVTVAASAAPGVVAVLRV